MEEKSVAKTSEDKSGEQQPLDPETLTALHRLAHAFERVQLVDYLCHLSSPRRLIFMNFLAGLFRGFGFTLGATVLVAIAIFLLGHMVDIPLVGGYIAKIVKFVQHEIANHKF